MKPFVLSFLLLSPLAARDLHVSEKGLSIAQAIKLAEPGDTIHLEPVIYRDAAVFAGKSGLPGKPITLEGHGAILDGSEPLDPRQWSEVAPGLHAAEALLPQLTDAVLRRWFFLFDGQIQRMNRTSKGHSADFKAPEALQPGEWTFVHASPPSPGDGKTLNGRFFIRLQPNQRLSEARIALPIRSAGVQLSGRNAHLILRDLTATHVYNDGFNIHGDCREVLFERIRAVDCGDDGISAHESAQYEVRGFISVGNSTGICDTGTAQTSYRDVFIAECVGFDLYFLDAGRYTLRNAFVLSSAQNPLTVTGRMGGTCELTMDNVLIRRLCEPRHGVVTTLAVLKASHCRFDDMDMRVTGSVTWDDCVMAGQSHPPQASGPELGPLLKLEPTDLRRPR